MNICGYCDYLTSNPEDDFGEFICDNCQQNREEAAYERYCEDFHDGGARQSAIQRGIERREACGHCSAAPLFRSRQAETNSVLPLLLGHSGAIAR